MTVTKRNYSAFAEFANDYHDAFTLKRFRALQIKNLLYYQAELAHLKQELEEIEQKDMSDQLKHVTARWKPENATEKTSTSTAPTISSKYSEKMLRIRETLTDYHNAVEQYRRLDQMPKPHSHDIKATYDWLNDSQRGGYFLAGSIEDVWNQPLLDGSPSPASPDDFYSFVDHDAFSFSLGRVFAFLYRLIWCGSDSRKAHHIDTTSSGRLGQALLTMVASVLPVLPIVAFYFEERLSVRIGLIAMFTAVFAAILVVPMGMRPDKALAITTAIEAIQVVYVGGTSNSTSS